MDLSVIIVNYNVKYFLELCLHSVLRATTGLTAEVIVVDNHSTDNSLDYLRPVFPGVHFIESDTNLGFGKANNLALATARGTYILFLNPDTIVPEDCFHRCIGFFNEHPRTGALGVKMLDGSGRFLPESKRSFPTATAAFYKLAGLSALFPSSGILNKYALGHLDENQDHTVDVLAGAFMMVRKSLLDKTGAFDEQFFMYGEDIDLSFRLKQAGSENHYFAGTCIIHFKGESLKKWSADHVKVFYEAMLVFVNKHYNGSGAAFTRMALKSGIGIKRLTRKIMGPPRVHKRNPLVNALIIGDAADAATCRQILRLTNYKQLSAAEMSAASIRSNAQSIATTEIVFCTEALDYKNIITLMQELGAGYSYRFHVKGSRSVIGSASKDIPGEVIVQ